MQKLILLFCLFVLNLSAQTPIESVNTFLQNEQIKPATVAFKIFNISNQKEVLNYNGNKLLVPASLQKIVTTSIFLKMYEPSSFFSTKVNFKGVLVGNKFTGIIEVKGSGDPSIDEIFIDEICVFLKEKGIEIIEGYITVDDSVFDKQAPKTWLVEDVANYYGATAFGFNYKKNTYKLKLQQTPEGTSPKIVSTTPYMRHFKFDNQLVSDAPNTGDNAYFLGMPFSNNRQLVGKIPAGDGIFTIKGAINNPSQIFKNELIKKFQSEGIGFVFNKHINPSKIAFSYEHKSVSFAELVNDCNQKSINLYAEVFLKMIGKGSTEKGIEKIIDYSTNKEIQIYDGSGLSRKDLLSANFLIKVLKNNAHKAFTNSLGVSGISGTMKYFKSEKTKGKIKAKSGSADGILNYAGYYTNKKGEQFAFVLMVNSYIGKRTDLRKKMVKVFDTLM